MKVLATLIWIFLLINVVNASGQSANNMISYLQDSMLVAEMMLASSDSIGIDFEDVPNVFSPNGDRINDYFIVDTPDGKIYDFRIFTRTGTQVYHTSSPQLFWDGRNTSGIDLPEGIYYYVIELAEDSNTEGIKGFIYLFR